MSLRCQHPVMMKYSWCSCPFSSSSCHDENRDKNTCSEIQPYARFRHDDISIPSWQYCPCSFYIFSSSWWNCWIAMNPSILWSWGFHNCHDDISIPSYCHQAVMTKSKIYVSSSSRLDEISCKWTYLKNLLHCTKKCLNKNLHSFGT